MRKMLLALAMAALLPMAGAAPPPAYFVDEAKLPFAALPGLPAVQDWGVHNGAGYRIEVPQNWNRKLVLWAHGFRGTGLELTVDNHPLRAYLLANGFAWAASSYGRNAYDPAQGAKDTHALTQLFNGRYAKPQRVYLSGVSMGGHVVGVAAEQWAHTYDGALPLCGVMGDYELFDYFLDFNVAAQAMSGMDKSYPYGADYLSATVPATKAALGPAFPFALNPTGLNFKGLVQQRSGGVRPLFDQGWLFWNGVAGDFLFGLGVGDGTLPRQPGMAPQNIGVVYQFDADPAQTAAEALLNTGVQRVKADPQARHNNGMANVPPVNGRLKIPTLSMHTLGDLFVPFSMQQIYARRAEASGTRDLLVQRATRDYGHCSFTGPELVRGFSDLVNWVENGQKPAGDDVLDAAAVASPTFGCTFTDKASPRQWDQVPALGFLRPPACPAP